MKDQRNRSAHSFGQGLGLSFEARAALSRYTVLREQEWTTSASTLLGMLQSRGISVPPNTLEVETSVGGALLASGRHMGIFASLRHLEREGPLSDGDSDFPNRTMRTSNKQLLRLDSESMLPLIVGQDPELWLGFDGAVYLANRDDDYGYTFEAFDTFTRYVEVFAFLRESLIWPPAYAAPKVHRLFTASLLGERLSAALGAWPVAEAWGPTSRVWVRDELHVAELTIDGFVSGTHVGSADVDAIIEALVVIEPRVNDVEWQCPVNARNAAWSAAGLPQPTRTIEHAGSKIRAWGSGPSYGFEMKQRWSDALKRDRNEATAPGSTPETLAATEPRSPPTRLR